jgi:DNA-binding transcriptional ArsR family regulator
MNTHDEIFKAMADSSRRRILAALCQESREAGELARMVGLAPNAVSFHLRALKSAELVNVQREGRFLRYSIDPQGLQAWREQVDRLFSFERVGPRPQEFASHSIAASDAEPAVHEVAPSDDQLPTELL